MVAGDDRLAVALGLERGAELAGEPLALTRRHTHGESGLRARKVEVTLERQEAGVLVRAHEAPIWVTRPGVTDPATVLVVTERGRVLPLHASPEMFAQIVNDARLTLAEGASRCARYPLPAGGAIDVLLEVIHPPIPLAY